MINLRILAQLHKSTEKTQYWRDNGFSLSQIALCFWHYRMQVWTMIAQQSVPLTFGRGDLWACLAIFSCYYSVNCHVYAEVSEVSGTVIIKKCQLSIHANGRWFLTCLCTLTKPQISSSPQTDQKMDFKPITTLKSIRHENSIKIHLRKQKCF